MPLLLHGREVATDAAKGCGASRTAKGARMLLLHFGPAPIPLCQVVRKRNREVVEQSQHLIGSCEQSIQQILGLALFGPAFAFFTRREGGRRLSSIARRQDLEIVGDPVIPLDGGNCGLMEQTPLVTGVVQIEQELLHLAGPRLLLLLGHGSTVSDQMGGTDAMSTVIAIIARQSVVHRSAPKARPDANLVHGLAPT